MANEEQLALLKRGSGPWNQWRSEHRFDVVIDLIEADLAGADLSFASLSSANLSGANLAGANLTQAQLYDARLQQAKLSDANLTEADLTAASMLYTDCAGANLTRANLNTANLIGADLAGADLTQAKLAYANLSLANFADANLTGAELIQTVFGDVDLSQVVGIDACVHYGRSTISSETLLWSGPLPLSFLRGCGLPDRLIDYLPSLLATEPIQFYSCFISYSTANQDFSERLYADLQSKGVRCWFAPHSIRAGKKLHAQIDEAIRVYDRLLLILSPESMTSEWVATEIAKARKKEATQKRQVLFPISIVPYKEIESWELFDADRGKDSAREIREYFIPDFSTWKNHETYTKAFDGLLKSLKSEDAAPSA